MKNNCRTCHLHNDADILIVQTDIDSAIDAVLIGDDTDLLVLLCYYTDLKSHNFFFRPEAKRNQQQRIWNIKVVKAQEMCTNILFIHAILGCDIGSQLYGIGKRKLSRNLSPTDTSVNKPKWV